MRAESVVTAINSSEAGVKASYSKVTNEFLFTANEMGTAGKIEFGMAQRADEVAGAIVETCESCGIHAAIVAAAGVTGSALTRRWRCVRGRG